MSRYYAICVFSDEDGEFYEIDERNRKHRIEALRQFPEFEAMRDALFKAGDLLFDMWDGDPEMLARYETVNNLITRALTRSERG